MIKIESIRLKKYIDYDSDLHYVSSQITRDGALLLIESVLEELDFFHRPVLKYDWTICVIKNHTIQTIELKDVPLIPTEIDLFTDGSLLIVQGRCVKNGDYIEKNARRYSPNGELLDEFTLGDGIANVQIDETDTIWVSYYDEGIGGNFGWEEPIGRDGFLTFTKEGQKVWGAEEYSIDDCYAMNIASSKEVYFYYYSDFYLVQLCEGKEAFRYPVRGDDTLQQFMFDTNGMIGQIDIYTFKRYKVKAGAISAAGDLQLIDESGKRFNDAILMRGKYLYAFKNGGWYRKEY